MRIEGRRIIASRSRRFASSPSTLKLGSELDHRSRVVQASRRALAPGLFVRAFEDGIIHAIAGVDYTKRPAYRIRREKSPGADAA